MGKGGRVRLNNNNSPNNGGIMGSGVFGMLGTTVRCDANDNSFFCSVSKLVNLIMMFFFLAMVFYLLHLAFKYFSKGKKIFGGKK
jgi:uncharacterized membrane protein